MRYQELLDKHTNTPAQLAKKHGVPLSYIQAQLDRGIRIESEHTSHERVAREIALDHLGEDPDYYKKLAKVEVNENWKKAIATGALAAATSLGHAGNLPDLEATVIINVEGQKIVKTYNLGNDYESPLAAQKALDQLLKSKGIRNYVIDVRRVKDKDVDEAFNQPYKTKSEKSEYGDVDMLAKLPDGSNLSIMFNQEYGDEGEEVTQVEFYRNNSQEVTGEGDAQRIFATVLDAIQKYIKKYKPQKLSFSASKEVDMDADHVEKFNPESRAKLYDRLVQRYARAWGYRAFRADTGSIVRYELSRLAKGLAESKTVEYNGITLRVTKPTSYELKVEALDDWGNKVLGYVEFDIGDSKELDPQDLRVDDRFQGQGIARTMYDYVKSLGYTINRSWDQTDAGAGFWNKHRGEDVRVWEQGMAENFADGKNPGRRGLAKHLIRESASEREIAQVQYMQGECAVLALTIHKMDPQRFPLGFVYEFFDAVPDMYIEPDEFDELDPAQQQDIQYNHKNWTLTHAYVYDVKTQEYIDAEGRHKQLPTIGREFNATRHNKFPAEVQDLVRVSHYMEWDEAQEKWIVLSGWDALDKAYTPEGQQRAREYAIKYLGIDRPEQDVAENFADGKNPGRKGLSKRMGVNTKASVSDLRKTAKNSSGEKQRMAHWLANMKAGRAKHK